MPTSRLDTMYRKMILAKYFTKGWGDPDHLMKIFAFRKLISNRSTCYELVPKNHPINITKEVTTKGYRIIEGKFRSPLAIHLPDVVPEKAKDACFQMILPLKWPSKHKPICIQLAGTGDHNYWRRRNIMAKPLLKYGIGSIILENPFYGHRKPTDQKRSCLHNVSDIFVMGGCLILECLTLLHWCEQLGYGPLGLSGMSMGGHMASLAATNWPKPVVLVPCLSWTTASIVFIEGVMSYSIDWNLLQEQYMGNSLFHDKLANLVKIIDKGFLCDEEQIKKELTLTKNVSNIKQSSLLSPMIPRIPSRYYSYNSKSSLTKRPRDAVRFMCGAMDECTHLRNFSVPFDTSLITTVCAQLDGYVPREGCATIEEIWPGATVHYLNSGHVGAFIWYNRFFRKCIVDAFDKAKDMMV